MPEDSYLDKGEISQDDLRPESDFHSALVRLKGVLLPEEVAQDDLTFDLLILMSDD